MILQIYASTFVRHGWLLDTNARSNNHARMYSVCAKYSHVHASTDSCFLRRVPITHPAWMPPMNDYSLKRKRVRIGWLQKLQQYSLCQRFHTAARMHRWTEDKAGKGWRHRSRLGMVVRPVVGRPMSTITDTLTDFKTSFPTNSTT